MAAGVSATIAMALILTSMPLVVAEESVPLAAGTSCDVSENTVKTCTFTCYAGATLWVQATNGNELQSQLFSASCGTGYASCRAGAGGYCEGSDKTDEAGTGTCNMEGDGEGNAKCWSEGGEPGEDPVCIGGIACVCPSGSCTEIPTVPNVDIMDIVCRVSTALVYVSSTVGDGSGDLSVPQHPDPGVDSNAVDADLEDLNVPDIAKLIPPCVA